MEICTMPGNREIWLRHLAQTSQEPLLFEAISAEGCSITGANGKPYLDMISGISVSGLGHGHPEIVGAIKSQADRHLHLMVYGEFVQNPQTELAEALSKVLPVELDNYYFLNSGSEATELAIKLARRFTGRTGLVAQELAYHGGTNGALSLMSDDYFTAKFRPLLPEVSFIRQNDIRSLSRIRNHTAAVFMELVQAEKGCYPASPEFVSALKKRCDETGALLVVDEIQTGMGRTGSLFCFEQYGIVPDIVLAGKGFGAGMPIGAVFTRREIMHSLSANPVLGHITTFGGHPLSCAAALAGLNVMTREQLWERAAVIENMLRTGLKGEKIREIRGKGALLAIDVGNAELALDITRLALAEGIITDWFLFAPHCVRLAPPLVITDEELNFAIEIFNRLLR